MEELATIILVLSVAFVIYRVLSQQPQQVTHARQADLTPAQERMVAQIEQMFPMLSRDAIQQAARTHRTFDALLDAALNGRIQDTQQKSTSSSSSSSNQSFLDQKQQMIARARERYRSQQLKTQ